MQRRTYLKTAGTGLLAAIAGCVSGSDGSDPADTTDATTSVDTTTTPSTTESTTTSETSDSGTTATTTATTAAPGDARLTNASFEDGTVGWEVGTDLPDDPNKTTGKVDAHVETTTERASDGDTALALFVDGSQDDGTLWVQQEADLSGVSTLAVDYYTTSSFNERSKAAVYAGPAPEKPLTESEFDVSNSIDGHESEGWRTFEYDVSADGTGIVAVGITVVWETGITNVLDDVRLTE